MRIKVHMCVCANTHTFGSAKLKTQRVKQDNNKNDYDVTK